MFGWQMFMKRWITFRFLVSKIPAGDSMPNCQIAVCQMTGCRLAMSVRKLWLSFDWLSDGWLLGGLMSNKFKKLLQIITDDPSMY